MRVCEFIIETSMILYYSRVKRVFKLTRRDIRIFHISIDNEIPYDPVKNHYLPFQGPTKNVHLGPHFYETELA